MNDYFLNQTLRKLYLDRLPTINSIIHANIGGNDLTKVSGPFMMHVYPEYIQANKKILFVGMETHTWEPIKFDELMLRKLFRESQLTD
ncbi:hypothetical protein [Larkinella punicea]|uniref:Uncharacterized protein n=1 Tax=Larkinella punicea TaxID=2315727 RepID=A0A368JFD8_9BACT|nr:hypothetical protein [Larkinella punicea]RCR66252.1 hypothetical protein DUE52_27325 [Larkinella punicea]